MVRDRRSGFTRRSGRLSTTEEAEVAKSVIGVGNTITNQEVPPNVLATQISPSTITIANTDSGDIATIVITDGFPAVFSAIVDGGTDAALFTEQLITDNSFKLTLSAAQAVGQKTLWVKVTNAAGQSGEIPITVNVIDPLFATPADPFSSRSITLDGGFPATVTASNVAGIAINDTFADSAALVQRITNVGGAVSVNVPEGTEIVWGGVGNIPIGMSLISPKGTYAPFAAGKGPTSYLVPNTDGANCFSISASNDDPNAHYFVQGFVVGSQLSRINQDTAWGFTSGGVYQIVVGDTVTGASSGQTAEVKAVHLDSGSWAAGTAAGRLVLSRRTGNFTAPNGTPENLNVGANLNVATLTNASFDYGPRKQFGLRGFRHEGLCQLTVVSCYMRRFRGDGVSATGDGSINNATQKFDMYDCLHEGSGTTNLEHNIYIHRQTRFRMVRSGTINPAAGGHPLKSENYRGEIVDNYVARDHEEFDTISTDIITVGTGTQAIVLDGPLCSGGVATLPQTQDLGYPLVRAFSTGNCSGRWLNLTGTNAADAVITDSIRLGAGGSAPSPVWSNLRFKTITAADITNVAGATVLTGQTLYLSIGHGNPGEGQSVLDASRVQDLRVGRNVWKQISFGTVGGRSLYMAARTDAMGGYSPNKTPPFTDLDDVIGGLGTPFQSNNYTENSSTNDFVGLCTTAIAATATTLTVKNLRRAFSNITNITLSTSLAYTVRVERNDGTIGTFTATPSAAGAGTATIPLGGQVGGGGVSVNAKIGIKLAANAWDKLRISSRWANRADPNYFFGSGTRGIKTAGGILDLTKQANFETKYFEENMLIIEMNAARTLFGVAQEFQHATWANSQGGFLIEFPLPPINRPQGPHSVAFYSGGTYTTALGETVTGATSGATGIVTGLWLQSGSFAAGTAAGIIYISGKTGTFQAENLNVAANLNVMTIDSDFAHDWPDVAGAATLVGLLEGWGFGTQCSGLVDGDTLGAVCDVVWPWPTFLKNFSWHVSSRSTGAVTQFAVFNAPQLGYSKVNLQPDVRWLNSSGILVPVTASNLSPMSTPAMTTITTSAAATATKLYVASTSGVSSSQRIHVPYPMQPGADRSLYMGTVQSIDSDGGGPFINITPGIDRTIPVRSQVSTFTAAGADPANWVPISSYGAL